MYMVGSHHQSPPDLQKKFDHGTKNEVNPTATLISTIVPAYLPACYAFYEVGPTFVNSHDRDNLLEVSADGILQCSFEKECPNYNIHGEQKILVEIKSPVPQENVAETIFYQVPSRYMPQVHAQLKAYMCKELWLLCSTATSATVILVYFNEKLWVSIWNIVIELFSPEKPKLPTKLHPEIKTVCSEINESKKTHTLFLCEVPTVTGEYGTVTIPCNFSSPYATAPGRINMLKTTEMLTEENLQLSVDVKCTFKQCHEVLRDPGRELLVFMLTDKDRKQANNVPYSYLVAYALKGASMTNSHLKYLVDTVRDELLQRNIPVLCEAYDGQWHKFITEDVVGNSLTLLHGRDNWNKYSSMSKDKCIEQVAALSVVKKSTLKLVKAQKMNMNEHLCIKVVHIMKGANNELIVSSVAGKMKYVHSVHPISRPDLFQKTVFDESTPKQMNSIIIEEDKYIHNSDGYQVKRKVRYKCICIFAKGTVNNEDKQKKKGRIFGLQENEQNLLDVMFTSGQLQSDEDENNDNPPDTPENPVIPTLEGFLCSDKCLLLPNILNELTNSNQNKWEGKTVDDLFPGLLNNGPALYSEATVKDLNIICVEMRCFTGCNWCSSNMVKAKIVNVIVKAFGGDIYVDVERRKKKVFNPETLTTTCVNHIKSIDYPAENIQIPLASLQQIKNRSKWINNTTVPLSSYVPGSDSNQTRIINFFCYPAYSRERKQIEFRTFDFTHILTN